MDACFMGISANKNQNFDINRLVVRKNLNEFKIK